ncbi:hypothetical protein BCR32DRAFT_297098 [Anaeromyces robustus]|uniref:Uncharacterized protein n=1 Tax=Anaeromyces robustus TaxID=1754192 RepID=A0A1Y1WNH4_9FUNG|nr:hypothetical protein BCR32DRAFT_297098 [Anaeromyces robustus]|eukprot:ORX75101.1 hypothetical protein BCR32DRAFT_297098 [Anaeromyces robustus]
MLELIKNGPSEFEDCASITREPESIIPCNVAYIDDIQNTIKINESLQLANALSYSKSTYENDSSEYTESLEKVHNVIDSESLARTQSKKKIFLWNLQNILLPHMVSEEDSHTVTNSKEITDEINWNESVETSHTDEIMK